MKPPTNYLKPPETTWNQPHYITFYLKKVIPRLRLSYYSTLKCFLANLVSKTNVHQIDWNTLLYTYFHFNIYFFQNFCHSHFFGRIWSQNLKFFKLTEIWYRGKLLYAYYNFNVYFFKIFVTHVFWANLFPNLDFFKLT